MGIRFGEFVPTAICSADSGDGGDGGGGSAFNPEQMDELRRMINGAQSNYSSRISKGLDQKLDTQKVEFAEQLAATLDEFRKSIPEDGKKPGKGNGKGNGVPDGDAALEERIAEIERAAEARVAAVEKQWKAEKQAREEEAARNIRNTERSNLGAALAAAGVEQARVRSAVALLHTEDARVHTDKNGAVVMKFQREGFDESVPLDDGIDEWLKSPEGKHFAPARDARGSGASAGRRVDGKAGGNRKAEAADALVRLMLEGQQ